MTYRLDYTAISDRGLVRGNNEDSAFAGPHLLVLADGMGGHAAGEVASQIMVESLKQLDRDPEDNDVLALLGGYADDANRRIARTVAERPETEGMGTTLTALLFDGTQFGLIHVGDSRGYRLRDGKLSQITVDDTFVQSLVEQGKLAAEDVSSHPQKSLILKAYTGVDVDPHLEILDAKPGDRLMLCSDGLSDPVTAETIEKTLETGSPEEAASKLIELALRSGGPDNVTVVVADVVGDVDTRDHPLPNKAVIAGAPLGDKAPESHPDTSAGRAAALTRVAKVGENGQVLPTAEERDARNRAAAEAEEDSADEEGGPRSGKWITLAIILVLILAIIGGGWWGHRKINEKYFISSGDNEAFTIEQGVNHSLFGYSLHKRIQVSCISRSGELRFVDANNPPSSCNVFTMKDLPSAKRVPLDALEKGSYDAVTQQLRRLAGEAMPACVSKVPASTPPPAPGQPAPAPANQNNKGDLSQPGVNCREVKD